MVDRIAQTIANALTAENFAQRLDRSHGRRDRLPQVGPTYGAAIFLNGAETFNPSAVKYEPPKRVGTAVNGNPFYQGKPKLTVQWRVMDTDQFQFLSSVFYPILNNPEGPIVTVGWYNPYTAGAYEEQKAYMEWPMFGSWEDNYYRDCVVVFSRFGLRPEEIVGYS